MSRSSIEVLPSPAIQTFLKEVERLMAREDEKQLGKNKLFSHNVQMVGGRSVGFMDPDLFSRLCEKHKLDAKTCDALFLQISGATDPHLYAKRKSTILPLGKRHGYERSKGGIYIGEYRSQNATHDLRYVPTYEGNMFSLHGDEIHFFAPAKYAQLSALAFVAPGIKKEDGSLDIVEFPNALMSVGEERASVIV